MSQDLTLRRKHFPALNQEARGQSPVFLDGPGGTQVPQTVLDAMTDYLEQGNSNLVSSPFFAVERTHEVVNEARAKAAAFVNGNPDEIIFGANMTTITAHISRSVAQEWEEGDEIIVTDLDHFANVSFWERVAEDRGVKAQRVRLNPGDCTLDMDHLEQLLSPKTKLVAFTLASNVCGSHTDAVKIIKMAQSVDALTYVDSVHYAPHYLPDVQALGCDFLACSAYKFFGPHLGFVWGRKEHLERLRPYKVEHAPDKGPEAWETGTKSFEALAGFRAAIDYLGGDRQSMTAFYEQVADYERMWTEAFLSRAKDIKGLKVHGITDPEKLHLRTPTFALTMEGHSPQDISDHLARRNIITGAGHFYGKGVTDALDLKVIVRVGCVHYNTLEDMNRLFEALEDLH